MAELTMRAAGNPTAQLPSSLARRGRSEPGTTVCFRFEIKTALDFALKLSQQSVTAIAQPLIQLFISLRGSRSLGRPQELRFERLCRSQGCFIRADRRTSSEYRSSVWLCFLTFELRWPQRCGALGLRRKIGRRPGAAGPVCHAVGAQLERGVRQHCTEPDA
jgi:hypothetical protein